MPSAVRRPAVPATAVAATPLPALDKSVKSRWTDQSLPQDRTRPKTTSSISARSASSSKFDPRRDPIPVTPIINITPLSPPPVPDTGLADELDYITVSAPPPDAVGNPRPDKASRILGIKHRRSMEPIPASTRNSLASTRSARDAPPIASFTPTLPLTSLYVVSGLPKSPHTWTLADPDSVLGLHHTEGAVNRWWRPEVLGSTISPGAGGGKKKKRGKTEEIMKGAGALSKQEVGKMLSKALKVSFFFFSSLALHAYTHQHPSPPALLHSRSRGYRLNSSASLNRSHLHFYPSCSKHTPGSHAFRRLASRFRSFHNRPPFLGRHFLLSLRG